MSFLGKVKKKLRNGSWYPFYNTFYEKNGLDPHMILLESRSGKALESNILSLLKELCKEPYHKFTLVLSVHKSVKQEIREKLHKNSITGVHFVRTGSVAYYRALSRAGYLVNDSSFPGRFVKKEGQIYLNTWHGTPLKKMGRDNRPEMVTMGNVLRNLLASDYLVFPNRFMEEKMSGAYMLDSLYRGTVLHEGYPRNDIFHQETNTGLKKQAGFDGKKLLAYLPTFRGNFNNLENQNYMQTLQQNLELWDSQLNDDEILLIKLHPFLHGMGDFSGYQHILPFPSTWDTYEGLSVCDTLITDYSSVFYDFANSGRKVILFAYDRKEYESSRGMYEEIDSYPFDYTENAAEVIPFAHRKSGTPDEAFMQKYASYEDGHGAEKICRQVFLHENICRKQLYNGNGKHNILIYAGDLDLNGITTVLCSLLHELELTRYNYFISFRSLYVKEHPERLERLPEGVGILPLASEMNMDLLTMVAQIMKLKGHDGSWSKRRLDTAYKREWKKHFGSTVFSSVIHYNGYEAYTTALLEKAPCPKSIWIHNDMAREVHMKRNMNPFLLKDAYRNYDHIIPVSEDLIQPVVREFGADISRITVIHNCHDYKNVLERSLAPVSFNKDTLSNITIEELRSVLSSDDQKFISIGRFSPEKGHKRLLDAFNHYWKEHPSTWLIIIGGVGNLYNDTLAHAKALESADHIILIRAVTNPMPILRQCDLFLLSSYYEGQGIVLMEAATLGIPVMACDVSGCHSFLKEYNGLLLEDSQEGLLHGMNLFAEGKVSPLNIDSTSINRTSAAQTEALIANDILTSSRN